MSHLNEELATHVIEVTGASKEEAEHLLGACANNVEAAVALYFEQGVELTASGLIADFNSESIEDDLVRAPIAPMREQLLGPEDDNFLSAGTSRITRLQQRVKICPLRDFAREGALMEEELQAAGSDSLKSTSRRRIAHKSGMVAVSHVNHPKSTSTLGDLFRPPTDIAYAGTFQSARARAFQLKQWLLVNVQSDNFNSQLLNRDVWSDRSLRKICKRLFMLWQVDAESSEGRRFVAFYHCSKLPYVCVIDPRTGEEVWNCTEPKLAVLMQGLQQFIRDNKAFIDEDTPSTSKRNIECVAIDDDEDNECVASSSDIQTQIKKRSKLFDLSEEEQIALAIRNSMQEKGKNSNSHHHELKIYNHANGSDYDNIDDLAAENKKITCESSFYVPFLGESKDEITIIKVRLLNAEGVDEVVQLHWPSDTRLHVLHRYIKQRHAHLQNKCYKLICAFPRKTLGSELNLNTLKEIGLHPSANLHVTLED